MGRGCGTGLAGQTIDEAVVFDFSGPRTSGNIDELEIITYDGLRMRVGPTSERELETIIAAGGRCGEIYAGRAAVGQELPRRCRQILSSSWSRSW